MSWDTGKEDGNYCLGFRQVRATFRAHVDFESEASHMRDLRRLPPGLLSGMVVSLSQALPSPGCFHVLGSHQQKGTMTADEIAAEIEKAEAMNKVVLVPPGTASSAHQ